MTGRIPRLLAIATFILLPATAGADIHTISGYILDGKSEETLVAATVYDIIGGTGTVTNEYGFYSISLPDGDVSLRTGYVGYRPKEISFALGRDTVINIRMEQTALIGEVTIIGNRFELGVQGSQMSAIDIPIEQIKAVPAMFGETDVLKALQLLPGVQTGSEGTAGLYVRGGSPDENLLLIDGVPVYNVNHMMGLFSTFNPDAIKNVTLYKGSFPAHYCGRLSSIVDVRMKDGDMHKYHGNVSIGLVSSKFNIEGPIVKGRTSFNLSARRTYSDLMVNTALWANSFTLKKDIDKEKTFMGYYFYDLNAKINHKFSDDDRLYLSFYSGDDDVYFRYTSKEGNQSSDKIRLGWKWGNIVTALRWNHVINPKLFMDASANYTQYRHRLGLDITEDDKRNREYYYAGIEMKSGIFDETFRTDFHYSPTPNHDVRFGTYLTHHSFRPDVMSLDTKESYTLDTGQRDTTSAWHTQIGQKTIKAMEWQLYAEDNISLLDIVKANFGLSYSFFNVNGRSYNALEPRLSGRVLLTDDFSLKAGYAYMTQYIHLLSNSSLSLPTDLWVPVTENIEPENSHQFALGAFYNIDRIADLSIEGYYKRENNLLEYKEGTSYMSGNTDWQDKVAMGRGWSYGIEFMAQRSTGRLNGWIAYTYSRTRRLFDRPGMTLNGGRPFDARYDRRHDFNMTGSFKATPKFDLSATWIYSTGNCGTIYTQYYDSDPSINDGYPISLGYAEQRNNFRMNPYHRLDLSFNFHKDLSERVSRTFNLSIYNAYNNMNPFLVYVYTESYYDEDTHMTSERNELRQLTLFPVFPSISYSLSF